MANKKYTVRDSDGKLLQKRFGNPAAARRWQVKVQGERELVRAGLELPPEALQPITVEEYSKVYMRRREAGETIGIVRGRRRQPAVKGTWIDEGTKFEMYINPAKINNVRVGGMLMHTITSEDWTKVLESARTLKHPKKRKKILSEGYLNRIRALLSRFYEDAILERHASRNPIAAVPTFDEGDPEDKGEFWSKDECASYLAVASRLDEYIDASCEGKNFFGITFYCWVIWELNGGPRVNEALAINHSDVNLEASFIDITKIQDHKDGFAIRARTKGKKSRIIGLNAAMREVYLELLNQTPYAAPSNFVFSRPDGRPESIWRMRELHTVCCRIAGVPRIRLHDLRHTFASQFLMAGGTLRELQVILGHASPVTTQRYGKLTRDHVSQKSNLLNLTAPASNVIGIGARKID